MVQLTGKPKKMLVFDVKGLSPRLTDESEMNTNKNKSLAIWRKNCKISFTKREKTLKHWIGKKVKDGDRDRENKQ